MPEGLRLKIGGDVSEAIEAQKTLTKEVEKGAGKIDATYKKTFSSVATSIKTVAPATRPAIAAISKLGENVETLRAKLLAKQSFLVTEKDIGKVAVLNAEIRELQAEITRIGNVGKVGFDNLGNAVVQANGALGNLAVGAKKSFSVLRTVANILPGLGISTLILGLFNVTKSMLGFGDSTEDTKKELEDFNRALKLQNDLFDRNISKIAFATKLQLEYAKALGSSDQFLSAVTVLGLAKQAAAFDKRSRDLTSSIKKDVDAYSLQVDTIEGTQKAIALLESRGADKTVSVLKEILDNQKKAEDARNNIVFANAELRTKKADEERKKQEQNQSKSLEALKKYIEDAKKLASELEKIGFIQPEFSFFDSQAEQLVKAKKIFADFDSRNLKIDPKFFKIEPTISEPRPEQVQAALSPIEQAIKSGIISLPPIELDVTVSDNLAQNAKVISDFQKAFADIGESMPTIDMEAPAGLNFNILLDSLRKFLGLADKVTKTESEKIAASFKKFADNINASIKGIQVEGIAGLGEALGSALTGGDISNIFQGFANAVASGVQAIGKQFIALGAVAVAAKGALKTLFTNPFAAVAAGVALVAVGAALKSAVGKGVPGFAAGGLVFGPTLGLVGEGVGTSRSNPEVIAPLDQLKGMLSDMGGGGTQRVVISGRLRGRDMALQNARTSRSQRRLGA